MLSERFRGWFIDRFTGDGDAIIGARRFSADIAVQHVGGHLRGRSGLGIAETAVAVDSGTKLDMLRAIGCDYVIDYEKEDFTKNGQRYDWIFDTKTNSSPLSYARSRRPNGKYITVGGRLRWLLQTLCLGPLVSSLTNESIRIVALKPNMNLHRVSELFQAGRLKCVLDEPYKLSEVPQAVDHFGEAKHQGKVVISVID